MKDPTNAAAAPETSESSSSPLHPTYVSGSNCVTWTCGSVAPYHWHGMQHTEVSQFIYERSQESLCWGWVPQVSLMRASSASVYTYDVAPLPD